MKVWGLLPALGKILILHRAMVLVVTTNENCCMAAYSVALSIWQFSYLLKVFTIHQLQSVGVLHKLTCRETLAINTALKGSSRSCAGKLHSGSVPIHSHSIIAPCMYWDLLCIYENKTIVGFTMQSCFQYYWFMHVHYNWRIKKETATNSHLDPDSHLDPADTGLLG